MELFSKTRLFAVAAVLLALTVAGSFLVPATEVCAAARRMTVRYFYSDSSHSDVVGWITTYCNGRGKRTGQQTPFSEIVVDEPCCGNSPC